MLASKAPPGTVSGAQLVAELCKRCRASATDGACMSSRASCARMASASGVSQANPFQPPAQLLPHTLPSKNMARAHPSEIEGLQSRCGFSNAMLPDWRASSGRAAPCDATYFSGRGLRSRQLPRGVALQNTDLHTSWHAVHMQRRSFWGLPSLVRQTEPELQETHVEKQPPEEVEGPLNAAVQSNVTTSAEEAHEADTRAQESVALRVEVDMQPLSHGDAQSIAPPHSVSEVRLPGMNAIFIRTCSVVHPAATLQILRPFHAYFASIRIHIDLSTFKHRTSTIDRVSLRLWFTGRPRSPFPELWHRRCSIKIRIQGQPHHVSRSCRGGRGQDVYRRSAAYERAAAGAPASRRRYGGRFG